MPDSETPQDNLANEDNLQSDAPNEEIVEEQTSSPRPRRQRTTRNSQSEQSHGDSAGNTPADPPPAPRLLETYRIGILLMPVGIPCLDSHTETESHLCKDLFDLLE